MMIFDEWWDSPQHEDKYPTAIQYKIAKEAWESAQREAARECAEICEARANDHGWNYNLPSVGRELGYIIRKKYGV